MSKKLFKPNDLIAVRYAALCQTVPARVLRHQEDEEPMFVPLDERHRDDKVLQADRFPGTVLGPWQETVFKELVALLGPTVTSDEQNASGFFAWEGKHPSTDARYVTFSVMFDGSWESKHDLLNADMVVGNHITASARSWDPPRIEWAMTHRMVMSLARVFRTTRIALDALAVEP